MPVKHEDVSKAESPANEIENTRTKFMRNPIWRNELFNIGILEFDVWTTHDAKLIKIAEKKK